MFSNLTNQVSSWMGKKPEDQVGGPTEDITQPPADLDTINVTATTTTTSADGEPKKDVSSPTKGGSKMEMLTNVKSQMSSWLGAGGGLISAVKNRATGEETVPDPPAHLATDTDNIPIEPTTDINKVEDDDNSSATEGADSEQQISENEGEEGKDGAPAAVGTKAIQGAKTFGNFLYSAVNKAGKTVSEASAKIKKTVEENTILGEFNKEQDAFIKNKQKSMEAAVAPWVGYPNEEKLKEEILSLSQDRRSFVRAPPTGVAFEFDYETFTPVAQALLVEDPELDKMRFELVPKVVNEETFWRNYFYRVSLIKQSNELTSLAQEGNINSSIDDSTACNVSKPVPVPKEENTPTTTTEQQQHTQEFASDVTGGSSEEEKLEALKELRRLGVADDDNPDNQATATADWEKELQAELKDFEVVPGKTGTDNWEHDVQDLLLDDEDDNDLK